MTYTKCITQLKCFRIAIAMANKDARKDYYSPHRRKTPVSILKVTNTISLLNIVFVIPFISVAKSKMY